ncbi:bifunctional diguanylate cyclase/phosphodiesterase [Thalassospira profundimaris]|uniref:sensor domain-containing protein n=1 Tax=Thalassospira profundimaris TaxID=502049 RepID=UPI000DEDC538|nr:bifunctional diguanylate cyclase/phosphodiesterase [Thalassospira profundimaris]
MGAIISLDVAANVAALIACDKVPAAVIAPDRHEMQANAAWRERFDGCIEESGVWHDTGNTAHVAAIIDRALACKDRLEPQGDIFVLPIEDPQRAYFIGWWLPAEGGNLIRVMVLGQQDRLVSSGLMISPLPVLLLTPDGEFYHGNAAAELVALEVGLPNVAALAKPKDQRPLTGQSEPGEYLRSVHYGQRIFQWRRTELLDNSGIALFGRDCTREESYRRALEHSVQGIVDLSPDGRLTSVSEAVAPLFGYDSTIEVKRAYLVNPERFYAREDDMADLLRQLARGRPFTGREVEMRRQDGSQIWIRMNATVIYGEGGILLGYSVTLIDVTKSRQAEHDLRRRQERYRALVQTAGSVIMFLDTEGRILEYNRESEWTFGYSWMEAAGRNFFDLLVVERERQAVALRIKRMIAGEIIKDEVISICRKDGEIRLLQWNARAHFAENGNVAGVICIGQDVTEKNAVERALRLAEEKYRGIFENSAEGLYQAKPLGQLLSANPAFVAILGYRNEEDLVADEKMIRDGFYLQAGMRLRFTGRLLRDGAVQGFEAELRRKDGRIIWIEENARLVRDEHGVPVLIEGSITDITERKRSEARIQFLAHHDGLTGLPNRTLFQERMSDAVARCKRENCDFALMLFDLDNFKDINDTLGHPIGDLLLQGVGERMRVCLRSDDVVARLGGDEFAVLMYDPGSSCDIANVAQQLIERIGERFVLEGNEVTVSTSVGICLYPRDGKDEKDLLRNADLALYCSKAEGRNRYQFFRERMQLDVQERKALERDLSCAIANGEFEVFYQPIVDAADHRIVGMEALVRWFHPTRGMVSPVEFISVAERMGIIAEVGKWVLNTACLQTRKWREAGLGTLLISVNLSPIELARHEDLLESVGHVLEKTGLDPRQLQLEVTEGAMMDNPREAAITLGMLRNQGIRIAIDDFGTGYSSLAYLKRFPVDKLKIDRSFVIDLDQEDGNSAIVRAVVFMARSFGMTINAEGIETKKQLERICAEGVDELQGFYFSKPLPAAEMEKLLEAQRKRASTPGLVH